MPILNDKFLKKDEVAEGDIIKFIDEGAWVESRKFTNPDGSPKTQFQITIELADSSTRTLSMNKMSRTNLKDKWGKNTADWVGNIAEIHFETALVAGKTQNILILRPIEEI